MMPELSGSKYTLREGSGDIDFVMAFGEKG
jgi:hypothetical protein